ncbi:MULTISPECIES: acyl carrier protein [unclassified Gordonia (in: high G+C Gram-positive bacteria)]|uniref:acyl carrier protein n=1 Tax=unclassified Gordonia (in: high G+C Gram-positive bacteria) TaxID=2657482 RepID=UPI00196424FC|nr:MULTISPECIES: acyl carrier protein [unclassified Gordonia (in: high G+C Gram-positive bacteria)]MBN0975567.1 acyl carrier protein [Gordonia sp. BP-119]MBN0985688.1 acyl carrier protein [Gordonia sp. BP-94]
MSASQSQIVAGIAEIVEDVTGIEPEEVTVDKSFVDDLDIDSLSIVEIVVQLEDKYGVKIADEDIQQLSTVGDAVAFVQRMEIENPAVAERIKATLDDSN